MFNNNYTGYATVTDTTIDHYETDDAYYYMVYVEYDDGTIEKYDRTDNEQEAIEWCELTDEDRENDVIKMWYDEILYEKKTPVYKTVFRTIEW